MKKMLILALISLFFVANGVASNASVTQPTFTIDGKPLIFNESTGFPYVTDTGRTMLPLRVFLNSIGCEVSWSQQAQTVLSHKGNIEVDIPIGKKEIRINQTATHIDTVAIIKNGRAYLPVRAVIEPYGYTVDWDRKTGLVSANLHDFTSFNINGGTTGIFSRKQLQFNGFDGVQADVTLPMVTIAEKGDCPYVYFGFDFKNDVGNVEGGFEFISDSNHPDYNKWTVCMRQNNDWSWGNHIALEQGSTHHIKLYSKKVSETQVDLVIELDGKEIIRKASAVTDFSNASVKAVTAMAMSKIFDGTNCLSQTENSSITNLTVSLLNSDYYFDFKNYELYREWRPTVGINGMWFGTADCIPSYLHNKSDGSISIYKGQQ